MASSRIYDYIERLSELLRSDERLAGAEHGLQPVQLEVLHYLSVCNQYSDTPMAVTEYLGQTKGTVSQTLKVLEKKGLLFKEPDKDDKRVMHLKVTEQGRQLLRDSIPTQLFVKVNEALTDEQQAQIEASLKLLLTTLLQANSMKTFGVCESCRYNQRTEEGGYFCDLVKQPLSKDDTLLICREHEAA